MSQASPRPWRPGRGLTVFSAPHPATGAASLVLTCSTERGVPAGEDNRKLVLDAVQRLDQVVAVLADLVILHTQEDYLRAARPACGEMAIYTRLAQENNQQFHEAWQKASELLAQLKGEPSPICPSTVPVMPKFVGSFGTH